MGAPRSLPCNLCTVTELPGLPAPSIIRPAKIATIEARDAEPIGTVPTEMVAAVLDRIAGELGR